jgi:putative ABC transport system substrate-binding protein
VICDCRGAEFHYDRLPALAADLVARKVDVIVTTGGATSALAAKNATSTIPIVFISVSDPIGSGLVPSLARPGGNVTGFSDISVEMTPKRLELLCELVPQATMIALLVNPDNLGTGEQYIRFMQEAARVKGVQLPVLKARNEGELDVAFASLGQLQAGGIVLSPDRFFYGRSEQLAALASRYAIPAIYLGRQFTAAGGLISYGTDYVAIERQAGIYVGRILKGEADGSTGAAADHLRAGRQSQDRQGARPHGAALNPRPRRRGHRMTANHPCCHSAIDHRRINGALIKKDLEKVM